jgi:hypothetical protein
MIRPVIITARESNVVRQSAAILVRLCQTVPCTDNNYETWQRHVLKKEEDGEVFKFPGFRDLDAAGLGGAGLKPSVAWMYL